MLFTCSRGRGHHILSSNACAHVSRALFKDKAVWPQTGTTTHAHCGCQPGLS